MMPIRKRTKGFTLVEAVMVITITGVLAAMVAVFIKQPVDAFLDSGRRAALSDEADTAVRRMARDIHKALPNSVRQADNQCIEFIPTKTGGRYRAQEIVAGDDSSLSFNAPDTIFNMFGSNNALPIEQRIAIGDVIAVYNLGMGITGANAYDSNSNSNSNNIATVAATPTESGTPVETTITIDENYSTLEIDSKLFPFASSSHRFYVIPKDEKMVSFVCSGGVLYRNSSNALTANPSCLTTGGAILATHVDSCNFVYNDFELQRNGLQRNGLVRMTITLTDSGESVRLYHEAHVNNSP